MGLSSGQRRNNRPRGATWYQVYRERIRLALEICRNCSDSGLTKNNFLTFDHLLPNSDGHALSFSNATILCRRCQEQKGREQWPWLISLLAEECARPPARRYALAAIGQYAQTQIDRTATTGERKQLAEAILPVLVKASPHILSAEQVAEAVAESRVGLVVSVLKGLAKAGFVGNAARDAPEPVIGGLWGATERAIAGGSPHRSRVAHVTRFAEIVRLVNSEAPVDVSRMSSAMSRAVPDNPQDEPR